MPPEGLVVHRKNNRISSACGAQYCDGFKILDSEYRGRSGRRSCRSHDVGRDARRRFAAYTRHRVSTGSLGSARAASSVAVSSARIHKYDSTVSCFFFVVFFVSFEALTYPAPQVATSIEKPSGRTVVRFMPDRAISRCFCALLGRLLTCRNVAQLLYHETLGLDGHSPFLTKSERSRRHDPMEPISTKVHRHGARRLRTLAIGLAKMSNLSTTVRLLSQ